MTNNTHDPLCPWSDGTWPANRNACACDLIAQAAERERERMWDKVAQATLTTVREQIARAIEMERDKPKKWSLAANEAFWVAARIAREADL